MRKLQSLVPSLRDFESGLSQVDIIEETISYIDQLHKRIAERMVSSGNSSQETEPSSLTLEHIKEAERLSMDVSEEGGYADRLVERLSMDVSEEGGYADR